MAPQTDLSQLTELKPPEIRNLLAQVPIGIAILEGSDHRFVFANEIYLKLLGGRDILGRTFREAIPELAGYGIYENLDRVYNTGGIYEGREFESELRQEDGHHRRSIVNFLCHPWKNQEGKVQGIIVSVVDVTEEVLGKRQAQLNAHAQTTERYKFQDLFFKSPAMMALWHGPNFIFEQVNPQYQALFPTRKLIGRPITEALPEIVNESFYQHLRNVWETGESFSAHEMHGKVYRTPDGPPEDHYFNFSLVRILDGQGKPYGIFNLAVNVTQQVQTRRLVEQNELRFHVLSEELDQIIWTTDPKGKFTFLSQQWQRLSGLSFNESIEEGFLACVHPSYKEKAKEKFKRAIENGENYSDEVRLLRKSDGEWVWFLVQGKPVRNTKGRILQWVGMATDINAQRLELSGSQSLNQALTEEREIRERFVAALTHDLRTPMTSAKLTAQLLEMKVEDKATRKLLSRITDNIDRADRMIQDLLDATRLKAGQGIPIKIDDCHMNKLIAGVIDDLSNVYGPRFTFENENGEVRGHWDHMALSRILENLLVNAIKYGAQNSIIKIKLKTKKDWVDVSVNNKGNPIPESEQQTIFNQYNRTTSAKSGEQKGWGVGLAVVRAISEAHGGFVRVESDKDEGTTFFVGLPLDSRNLSQ